MFWSGFQKVAVCHSEEGLAEFLESAGAKTEMEQRELGPGTTGASNAPTSSMDVPRNEQTDRGEVMKSGGKG